MKTKFMTWNVNGLRAVHKSGFADWFAEQKADVVCLQEIKVQAEQLTPEMRNPSRYHAFWHSAEKPGYSGVVTFSKREPVDVRYGMGVQKFDREGRVLTVEFDNHIVINSYFPNSQRDHARLPFKLEFCKTFEKHVAKEKARGKTLVLCADWNIAPEEIDLKNPKSNQKNAGFLPEERAWMAKFLKAGFVDGFRHFTPDPGHYTWWSYRPGVRERNVGWRLDYFLVDGGSKSRLRASQHQTSVRGSDHCPVSLEIQK
jgi:exodeoxyribonuclease-3